MPGTELDTGEAEMNSLWPSGSSLFNKDKYMTINMKIGHVQMGDTGKRKSKNHQGESAAIAGPTAVRLAGACPATGHNQRTQVFKLDLGRPSRSSSQWA